MDDLRTLIESIGEIADFAGILDERKHTPAHHTKTALSAHEKAAKLAARQEAAAKKKSGKKSASAHVEPTHALSRKQRKHVGRQEAAARANVGKRPKKHKKKEGDHKFANETTFKKVRGGTHDPGGALVSTPGLRKKLSRDPKRFLKFPKKSKRGRYPLRTGNRASMAGTLRQASKRDPFLYRKAVEIAKHEPGMMMHRSLNKETGKPDPSVAHSNVERPIPLGGKAKERPHGHGGLPPSPGPRLKPAKKETGGREKKHESQRKAGRKRANKDKFREAVTGKKS